MMILLTGIVGGVIGQLLVLMLIILVEIVLGPFGNEES